MIKTGFFGRGSLGLKVLELLLNSKDYEIQFIFSTLHSKEIGGDVQDFANLAAKYKIPFYYTQNINDSDTLKVLQKYDIDISFAILWLNTLTDEVTGTAKRGFVNIHSGPLPKYRGNACANWAILNDESKFGIAIHFMEGGKLDSGPIICNKEFEIEGLDISAISRILFEDSIDLFKEAMILLKDENFKGTEQEEIDSSTCYPRLPDDSLIDWRSSVGEIHKMIRASSKPYPGAFTYFMDSKMNFHKLTIYRANVRHFESKIYAEPGQLIRYNDAVGIIARDGIILIEESEVDGQYKLEDFKLSRRTRFLSSKPNYESNIVNEKIGPFLVIRRKISFYCRSIMIMLSVHKRLSAKIITIHSKEIWDNWQAKKVFCESRFYRYLEFLCEGENIKLGYWVDYVDGERIEKVYLTTNVAILKNELSANVLLSSYSNLQKIPSKIVYRSGFREINWAGWHLEISGNLYSTRRIFKKLEKKLDQMTKT